MHKLSNYTPKEQAIKRFLFFAECFLVKGVLRSAIYDVSRDTYRLIPNHLLEMIEQFEGKTLAEVKAFYGAENEAIVDKYFAFLEQGEYILWCDEAELALFPKIDLVWDYPAQISNAIIDIDNNTDHPFSKIFTELEQLGCKHLQIRSFSTQTVAYWDNLLQHLKNSRFQSVDILTKYDAVISLEMIKMLYEKYLRIHSFIVHSAPEYVYPATEDNITHKLAFVKDVIQDAQNCKKIQKGYFQVNMQLFMEAHYHHTYFNRKLCIDTNGAIKNCNTLSESFGNVKDTLLKDAIEQDGFQALWHVKKEETKVCQDCEFRYMCVDARKPLKGDDGLFYHETPCPYDPCTAKWMEVTEMTELER